MSKDPRKDPSCTDVIRASRSKIDTDREEGYKETWVYRKNGKCYQVEHQEYDHVGSWVSQHYDTWSEPIEITDEQYQAMASAS